MADAEGYLLSKTAVKQIAEVVRQVLGRRLPIAKKAGRTPSGGRRMAWDPEIDDRRRVRSV